MRASALLPALPRAIEQAVDAAIARKPPVIISVHSFTQAWKGVPRPWAVGRAVGQGPAPRARHCSTPCAPIPGIEVGDNVPVPLFRPAQGRHALPPRHGARLGACSGRGPAGSDPRVRRARREWAARLAKVLRQGAERDGRARCTRSSCTARIPTCEPGATPAKKGYAGHGRQDQDSSSRLPAFAASRRASSRAQRRAEYRSHGACRLLPQLPRRLVSGGRRGERLAAQSKEEAREIVYGMAYDAWKAKYQSEAAAQASASARADSLSRPQTARALDKRDKSARALPRQIQAT